MTLRNRLLGTVSMAAVVTYFSASRYWRRAVTAVLWERIDTLRRAGVPFEVYPSSNPAPGWVESLWEDDPLLWMDELQLEFLSLRARIAIARLNHSIAPVTP